MWHRLHTLFEKIENTPLTFGTWVMALLALISVRVAIELFFENITFRFADQFFYQFSHHYLIFLCIYLATLPLVVWFARVTVEKAALILLFGFIVIWTPPIVDEIISRGEGFWSFYSFDSLPGLALRYLTFFGDKPEVGITYGVRTEVGMVLLLMALYVWVRTRSLLRTLWGVLALYTTLFVIGVLPSLVTIGLLGPEKGFLMVSELDVARVMLTPEPLYFINPPAIGVVLALKMDLVYVLVLAGILLVLLSYFRRPLLLALWRNLRLPQVLYHLGLFLIGAGLVFVYEKETAFDPNWLHFLGLLSMLLSVVLAWITSVIVNDLYDIRIDRISNPDRPLITKSIEPPLYRTIGIITFGGSLLCAALISTQLAFLLILYQALAWLYSAPPLRLKRFPIIATLIAGSASMLIFFGGYLVFSLEKNIGGLPWSVSLLLFLAYTLLLPIKDFKDLAGDTADHVLTLPLWLGETKAKRLIGAAAFLTFLASPFVLLVRHLFPLALFFGSLAYWLLQISSADHRTFSYRHLAHWYIALVSGYVALLAWYFLSR